MQFSTGQPDVVRAINQRWLLKFWQRNLGLQRVPQWQAIKPENLKRLSDALSFLDVVGSGDDVRFQVRFYGETVSKAYGSPDYRGKHLDEIIPPKRRDIAIAPYRQAYKTGYPVYTIHDLTDRNGRVIHFERLLLPFSRDGENVDRILASFEFVCLDGAFECDRLLTTQKGPAILQRAVVVAPQDPR